MSIGPLDAFWSHKGKGSESRPVEAMLALKSWPHRGLRSLVYRVSKSLFEIHWSKIWYWPWKYEPKSVALSSFNLDCVNKFIRSLPRVGSFWYILTHLLVNICCISWAKALHLWPMRRAIGKASPMDAAKWRGYSLNICWPLQKLKYQDPASFEQGYKSPSCLSPR